MIDFGCAIVKKEGYDDDDDDYDNGVNDDEDNLNGDGNSNDPEQSGSTMHRTFQSWIETLKRQKKGKDPSSEPQQSTGTTAYWPPERFSDSKRTDHATDMWAVGVILFIMLTGVHPFDLTGVASDAEIAEQIRKDPSPPITPGLTSHLSPSAIDLIKMLMDKYPSDRLTADEMLQHPWIAGDEATTEIMEGSAKKLGKYRDLRAIIEAGVFSMMIERGSREMAMSEYTPNLVYNDKNREG